MMFVLLGPVGRVETEVISDGGLDTNRDEILYYLLTALSRGDVQSRETRLVLYCWVATVTDE